jgi:hypothetical protein
METIRNNQGFGLIEIIIGSGIAIIVLAVTVIVFTRSESILKDENDRTNIVAKGRQAVKILDEEIRMAGFGLPPNLGLTAINGSSLSFFSNLDDIRTSTPICSPCVIGVSTAGDLGDPDIDVVDISGFSDGDDIHIYYPSYNLSEFNGVSGAPSGNTITLASNLANNYAYGNLTNLVTVNKYNTVTIALVGTNITKTIDGNVTILVNNVSGFAFNYNGAATPADVFKISITMNLVDPDNPSASIEFKTDVNLRNS